MRQSRWHYFNVPLLPGSHLFGACLEEYRENELLCETTSGTIPFVPYAWFDSGYTLMRQSKSGEKGLNPPFKGGLRRMLRRGGGASKGASKGLRRGGGGGRGWGGGGGEGLKGCWGGFVRPSCG